MMSRLGTRVWGMPGVITELNITVNGRPAPQGSKHQGEHGQMREASVYLPAWRHAVKRAAYEQYRALGVPAAELPLFRGAVAFGATFWLSADQRADGPPDLDKLLRAVWDALTHARVWENDSRVIEVIWAEKRQAVDGRTGADIMVQARAA